MPSVPAPEPDPPFGTDSDDYRAWATAHASEETFRALYAPRAAAIRRKHAAGIRLSRESFLARLDQLCPET